MTEPDIRYIAAKFATQTHIMHTIDNREATWPNLQYWTIIPRTWQPTPHNQQSTTP